VYDLAAPGYDGDTSLNIASVNMTLHELVDTPQALTRHADHVSVSCWHLCGFVHRLGTHLFFSNFTPPYVSS
jgi:hypothetical protein